MRRMVIGVALAGLLAAVAVMRPATAQETLIVGLLSDELPLYEPETLQELKRLGAGGLREPIRVNLNDIGMYEAVLSGVRYWINPADVVTSDAKELQARCMASAGKTGVSTSARAFGSGCQ